MNDPFVLKENGDKAFAAGDLTLALDYYNQAITLRPQFFAACYQKGNVLMQLQQYLEASCMFWQSYLFNKTNITAALMAARALAQGEYSLEACNIFDAFSTDQIDNESLIYYIFALRQQGRPSEALPLLPRLDGMNNLLSNWAKAIILIDLNHVKEAQRILEPYDDVDLEGHITILLHPVYIFLKKQAAITSLLDRAIKRIKAPDYFCCQRIAIDVLSGENKTPIDAYRSLKRFDIIDAADYLSKHANKDLIYTGTTYQTFDVLSQFVAKEGLILEFGVRFGYSISHLAKLFAPRTVFGFDSFQGLPENWYWEMAGSYTTQGKIPQLAKNITLVPGWFNETLPDFKKNHQEPIAFINIDCDLYSSTKLVLDELGKQIIPGTVIVFDEYIGNPNWREDEFKAFQEWVKENRVKYRYLTASFYTKQVAVQIISKGRKSKNK
ncbi:TylF/MycF/NovP-related O-methyltransferase [Legionella shakespearei]|uniref:TPR repeat-containing protein n=1 Tax=Legionella shakespearei DSM 23087 TaxID=1122169 RepID=A0A0W0YL96_9GAMM|nr:class I SAM-dependent methyltransferase [Legionella shakespearei]KTD57492.1 TPR repeat-containing protein [Legionella shakespearei DSM 23087]